MSWDLRKERHVFCPLHTITPEMLAAAKAVIPKPIEDEFESGGLQ